MIFKRIRRKDSPHHGVHGGDGGVGKEDVHVVAVLPNELAPLLRERDAEALGAEPVDPSLVSSHLEFQEGRRDTKSYRKHRLAHWAAVGLRPPDPFVDALFVDEACVQIGARGGVHM